MFWVSQLSILGPSFFNIFLCDLSLYWKKPVLQVMRITIPLCYSRKFWRRYWVIRRRFDNVVPKIFRWFSNEEANHYNRHFLVNHKNHVSINVNDFKKQNSEFEKLLGIEQISSRVGTPPLSEANLKSYPPLSESHTNWCM